MKHFTTITMDYVFEYFVTYYNFMFFVKCYLFKIKF